MPILASRAEWSPETDEDRAAVLDHLARVLASQPFRNSRRYPALLRQCVLQTLSGGLEKLRERQLGVELFGRPPDYNTASDPIVRVTAAEVRKRLAQFYDGAGDGEDLFLELPAGSYAVRFCRHEAHPVPSTGPAPVLPGPLLVEPSHPVIPAPAPPTPAAEAERSFAWVPHAWWIATVIFVLLALTAMSRFWDRDKLPLLRNMASASDDTTVVLGQLQAAPNSAQDLPLSGDVFSPSGMVSVEGASTATSVCSALARIGGNCRLTVAERVDLSALQNRPAILIGAYNNPWVLRVTEELPFQFGPLNCKCILDRQNQRPIGEVDFSLTRKKISLDYSLLARFRSRVTDGPVLVVAGIAPMSTKAAAEFATSSDRSAELIRSAPKGWKGENVEAVLVTEVVDGVPGHTRILRSRFW